MKKSSTPHRLLLAAVTLLLTLGPPRAVVAAPNGSPGLVAAEFTQTALAQSGGGGCLENAQVDRQQDVEFGSPAGQALLMDAYAPPQGTPPFPAVVMIHGGGFNSGDKSQLRGESIWFAEHGYVAFSINYRLVPQFPFPAAIHDAETAVSYIRRNASRFQVDPKRIAVLGTSGGGTIALSLGAMSGAGTTGSMVTAVVGWSPPLDLLNIWQSTASTEIRGEITGYLGIPGQDLTSPSAQELARGASPMYMVGKSQPATLVANSSSEQIALPTAEAFVSKLKGLGVPSELLTPPSGHAVAYACTALQPSLEFINKYIGKSRRGSGSSEASPTPEQGTSPTQRPGSTAGPLNDQPSSHIALIAAASGVLVVFVVVALKLFVFRPRRRV